MTSTARAREKPASCRASSCAFVTRSALSGMTGRLITSGAAAGWRRTVSRIAIAAARSHCRQSPEGGGAERMSLHSSSTTPSSRPFLPSTWLYSDMALTPSRAPSLCMLDLIADLAYPLPVTVISRLLGVPAEDHLRLRSWSRAQLCCSFEASGLQPADQQERNCMVQSDLTAYFDELIRRRRREPGADLLSA